MLSIRRESTLVERRSTSGEVHRLSAPPCDADVSGVNTKCALRTVLAAAVSVVVATGVSAGAAIAKPLAGSGKAVVESVDGPTLLTVKVGRREVPVRLAMVDAPATGECGASEAKAALVRYVRRAPRRLSYSLLRTMRRGFARDQDGRLLAVLRYGRARSDRDLAWDLIDAEWARWGDPVSFDASADQTFLVAGLSPLPLLRSTGRGVWLRCGGRLHLPAGEPAPSVGPGVWNVNDQGVTTSIGSVALTDKGLTFGELAAVTPVELVVMPAWAGCTAYLPTLQALALSTEQARTCRDTQVARFIAGRQNTAWPGSSAVSRGPKVGDRLPDLSIAFPLADSDPPDSSWINLSGPEKPWAWQTHLITSDRGKLVESLQTFLRASDFQGP